MADKIIIAEGSFKYVWYEKGGGGTGHSFAGIEVKTKGGTVELDEMLEEYEDEIDGKKGKFVFVPESEGD